MRVNLALRIVTLLAGGALSLSFGCADEAPAPAPPTSKDAGIIEAGNLCPSDTDARVHYRSHDPNECSAIRPNLQCTTDQNGFDNTCGCGCIDKGGPLCPPVDDPAITWVSHDPSQCGDRNPVCPRGETPFNSSCGCGCTRPGG